MSTESVRARLAAATPGPWYRVYQTIAQVASERALAETFEEQERFCNADFITHARTDLELALAVIETATATLDHFTADTHNRESFCVTCTGHSDETVYDCIARKRLGDALEVWEGAP